MFATWPFFAAKRPSELPAIDAFEALAVPQGFVPPAFVPGLAKQLGLSPAALREVLDGSRALVDGRLRQRDELPLETYEAHTGVAGVRRNGAVPEGWIREALPLLHDAPMAYDLIQRWLVRAQAHRARLLELNAFGSLVAWEEWQAKVSIDVLAELARGGPMRWRSYVAREGAAPTCTQPERGWSMLVDADPLPAPDVPLQVALPSANEVALVYPHVTVLLTKAAHGAVVTDAFATRGASLDWTRQGALGFSFRVRVERRWLEGPLPDFVPDALPWSIEAPDDHVLSTRSNELSPIALWSPAAELRRVTPDARHGVLVRFGDEDRRRLTHRQLVQLHSGEPVPTRYDRVLHRAAAIAYHQGQFAIAVDGQVLRDGQRLARYRDLLRVSPPFLLPRPVAAFNETGRHFAWVSGDATTLHWVDLAGEARALPLAPFRGPLSPFADLALPARAEAALLAHLGAAPLVVTGAEALEEALAYVDEHREGLEGQLDALREALLRERAWPTLEALA